MVGFVTVIVMDYGLPAVLVIKPAATGATGE
jgi:hypothetical protein